MEQATRLASCKSFKIEVAMWASAMQKLSQKYFIAMAPKKETNKIIWKPFRVDGGDTSPVYRACYFIKLLSWRRSTKAEQWKFGARRESPGRTHICRYIPGRRVLTPACCFMGTKQGEISVYSYWFIISLLLSSYSIVLIQFRAAPV